MSRSRTSRLARWALTVALAGGLGAVPALTTASPADAATALGSAGSHRVSTAWNSLLRRTETVRWDPCTPIDYKINARLGGTAARADVEAAVARLSAASGLQFRYAGSTTHVPSAGRDQSRVAPLVIAWAPPAGRAGGSSHLSAGELGRGGWRATTADSGRFRISSGFVVLRAGAPLAQGFGPGVTRGRVLLHELGHAVGLEHVNDTVMAMHDSITPRSPAAAFQAGDLRGLSKVGRPAGCIR